MDSCRATSFAAIDAPGEKSLKIPATVNDHTRFVVMGHLRGY